MHAVQVDSGRRPVAELEVEGGLLDLERGLTGPAGSRAATALVSVSRASVSLADKLLGGGPAIRFQAAAMASAREEAAAHHRAPAAPKVARAPVVRAVSSGRQRPAQGVGGTARATASRSPPPKAESAARPSNGPSTGGDPGLNQAKA